MHRKRVKSSLNNEKRSAETFLEAHPADRSTRPSCDEFERHFESRVAVPCVTSRQGDKGLATPSEAVHVQMSACKIDLKVDVNGACTCMQCNVARRHRACVLRREHGARGLHFGTELP